jgi:hypothetical protein
LLRQWPFGGDEQASEGGNHAAPLHSTTLPEQLRDYEASVAALGGGPAGKACIDRLATSERAPSQPRDVARERRRLLS